MVLPAMGLAGHSISAQPLLDEQEIGKRSGIKSLITNVILVPVLGTILVAKIKAWSVLFGIISICKAVATIIFLSGWSKYRKVEPEGCPFTTVCRVLVASACKIFTPFPNDDRMIHKNDQETRSFTPTPFVRFLEKAAIILPGEVREDGQVRNKWKLCSVGESEETKKAVGIVPICLTFIVCGVVSSIGNTYFIEQATHMNRHLGKWNVPFPLVMLILLLPKMYTEALEIPDDGWRELYDGDDERFEMLFVFIAMFFALVCSMTAADKEKKRLRVIREHGLLDKPDADIPMRVYRLYVQFALLGGLDFFFKPGVQIFFIEKIPESMRRYVGCFSKGIYGLGYTCAVLSVYVAGKVSQIGGRKSWFQHTLNRSRLDRYYWFLAALAFVNLVVSIFVSRRCRYKKK